jgi:transcriptional regulator with XRE-family HTH domain
MPKAFHSAGYQNFCRLLIARRRAAGMTQEQVAQRLERPQSYVAKYERGERRIDVIEFLEIAAAIDFDPVTFILDLCGSRRRATGRRT